MRSRGWVVVVVCVCLKWISWVDASLSSAYSLHDFSLSKWELIGDASIHEHFIRLTPAKKDTAGALWTKTETAIGDWEVVFDFRIQGTTKSGAGGLAFWCVQEKPQQTGPLIGNVALFSGVGVLIDTYDGDKTGTHPWIFGLKNDGSFSFSREHHNHTANTRENSHIQVGELDGCSVRMRNLPNPTTVIVQYQSKILTVGYKFQPGSFMTTCFRVNNIDLPATPYFGFTSSTEEFSDSHDLLDITVRDFDLSQESPGNSFISHDLERIYSSVHADFANDLRPLHPLTTRTLSAAEDLGEAIFQLKEGYLKYNQALNSTSRSLEAVQWLLHNDNDNDNKTPPEDLLRLFSQMLPDATRQVLLDSPSEWLSTTAILMVSLFSLVIICIVLRFLLYGTNTTSFLP
ncbi:vesicular integral-membrane protein VIP36 [Pelomyxa schiedti]|nr:vesicular integral-membrane protein VIP36 [Pelomyxa schiedti]